jgi:hypothetical protein
MSASRRIAAVLLGVVCLGAVGALTACTGSSSPTPPPPSTSSSQPAPTPTPAAITSASAAVSSATTASPLLPTGCSQLLPLGTLDRILGTGLLGQVTYLKAAAVPKSGRTGRVTCGYGTSSAPVPSGVVGVPVASPSSSGSGASAQVTVSYITYIDAATAQSRVQTTVEADGASAVVSDARVNGKPAQILLGAKTTELVMADGARTVVVVLAPSLVSATKAPAALIAIAAAMLQFGRPPQSASPAASSS